MRRFTKNLPELVRESSKIDLTDSDVRYLLSPSRYPHRMDLVLMNKQGQFLSFPYVNTINNVALRKYADGNWVPVGYVVATPDDTDTLYNRTQLIEQGTIKKTDIEGLVSETFADNPGVTIAGFSTLGTGDQNFWNTRHDSALAYADSFTSQKGQLFDSRYISTDLDEVEIDPDREHLLAIYDGGGSISGTMDGGRIFQYMSVIGGAYHRMHPMFWPGDEEEGDEDYIDRMYPLFAAYNPQFGGGSTIPTIPGHPEDFKNIANYKWHGVDAIKYYTGDLKTQMAQFGLDFGQKVDWFVPSVAEMMMMAVHWGLILEKNNVLKSVFPDFCSSIPTKWDSGFLKDTWIPLLTCNGDYDSNPGIATLTVQSSDKAIGSSLVFNTQTAAAGFVWPMAHLPLDKFI